MVSWSWGIGGGNSLWVGSSSLIGDISNISIICIGGVLDMLDSAIRKSNRVSSLDIAGAIRGLLGIEVSLGVVIGNSIGVGVGGDLISISWSCSMISWGNLGNNWGMDSMSYNWGSMHNWAGNNWGVDSMSHNWGSMDNWAGNNWGSMYSMSNWSMDNWAGNSDRGSMYSMGNSNWGSMGDNSWANMWGKVSRVADNSSYTDGGMVTNVR